MKRLIICLVLLVFLILGLYYQDTLIVRLKLMFVSPSNGQVGNEYIFSRSGYDDYRFRFESTKSCLNKDYEYSRLYLNDKLKVSPDYYYRGDFFDEYYVVWQLEGYYYLLSSTYDQGYLGFALQKREGVFIADPRYNSKSVKRLSKHQSMFLIQIHL